MINISLHLILLSIALTGNFILLFIVFRSDNKSATNRIYSLLSLIISFWLASSYLSVSPETNLQWARYTIFWATAMSMMFLLLSHVFPLRKLVLNAWIGAGVLVSTLAVMLATLTPFVFSGVEIIDGTPQLIVGSGIALFAVLTTIFTLAAISILIRKMRAFSGHEKEQIRTVLLGIVFMIGFLIATVMIPVIVFHNDFFVAFIPIYALIFLGMTAYAIVKYQLFNLKVIATEALTWILWIILFSKIVVSDSVQAGIVDGFIFALSVFFGILLIRSIRREVRQREELQKLNDQLEEANVKLGELSRFKTQLLSLASHQIKSPLAAIKGFISVISDGLYGPIDVRAKEALGKVKDSADGLISLINTLLDLRKVDEGKMDYHFAKTDMSALIKEVISLLQPLADSKRISLSFSEPEGGAFLSADGQKLKQVVQNLIDNAIKYTPQGFVKVGLGVEGKTIKFSVSDSGLGISKEMLPLIFEEFTRDERVKAKILGTGLGLYIARKIVEAHGGKVWAESEGEGKGSRFFVTLPAA